MRRFIKRFYVFVTFVVPFAGIALALYYPTYSHHDKANCTMHCHNKGCSHKPVLPGWIASDEGLYGDTIKGLFKAGDSTARIVGVDRNTGYGIVNLLLFCFLAPLVHFAFMFLNFYIVRKIEQ